MSFESPSSTLWPNLDTGVVQQKLPFLLLALCPLWLGWRIWRFTLLPSLYPNDPKELPYWIPFVGHAFQFFTNPYTLLRQADRHFRGTKETYSINVMGNTIYVLTGINEASEVDKSFTRMTFEIFERRFMSSCGASEELLEKLFAGLNPAGNPEGFPIVNSKTKSLNKLTHDMHITQLTPGGHLQEFIAVSKRYFEERLHLDNIAGRHYALRKRDREIHVQLMPFISDYFIDSGQRMLFGDLISELDPNLIWTFVDLDDRCWQLLFNIPSVFAPKVYSSRDQMISSVQKYFDVPREERPNDSVWMRTMEGQMKRMGFTSREMATVIVPMYIGSNTSTRKACFWMIAFLLFNPELIEIVRQETKPAIGVDGAVDLEYLKNECPRLNSIWTETLRMSTSAGSFRLILEDTTVCEKILRKGRALLIPSRQLHFKKDVFGDDVDSFNPDRFLSAKSLRRSRSLRPFGGGFNHCPGRFVAHQQSCLFVALLLHRFDVELVGVQNFPRWGEGDPFPGMMAPMRGDDLNVRLKERTGMEG